MRITHILLGIILSFSCQEKKKEYTSATIIEDTNKNYESNASNWKAENFNVEDSFAYQGIMHFVYLNIKTQSLNSSLATISVQKGDKIFYYDTTTVELTREPFLDLTDLNNDGAPDILFDYLFPGRGTNRITYAYIFSPNSGFLKLKNAPYYSNLQYNVKNKKLESTSFYGSGVSLSYVEIIKDSLKTIYRFDISDTLCQAFKIINGKDSMIGTISKKTDCILPEIVSIEPFKINEECY